MNVLPVITRELRAEARHAFTYWLRVLGAGGVVFMAVFFVLAHGFRATQGAELFSHLHGTLHFAIWALVPLLTADCISRERREGTLGLLFLTPLKARDIMVAKGVAHGVRSLTLLAAVLPVITLPLLMGGVIWQQAASSLFLNAGAIALALAAGLLASALSTSWVRALILTYVFTGAFALLFCFQLANLLTLGLGRSPLLIGGSRWLEWGFQLAIGIDPEFFTSRMYFRAGLQWGAGPPTAGLYQAVLLAASNSFLICLLGLLAVVVIAAWITSRSWQQRPPHPLQVWFRQRLCTPIVMRGLFKRWMKRSLDRNPIGWLEQRTWSGRLVIWGWLAVMISIYSLMLTDARYLTSSLDGIHRGMGWLLLASMAVNASTSFRRERESRVLELLLVSPLSEKQIILGRLRGLWGQFLPSMALLIGGWAYLSHALQQLGNDYSSLLFFVTSFIAVPVIGLHFSLVCRNFLVALISTVLVGMIAPSLAAKFFHFVFVAGTGRVVPDFSTINIFVVQMGLAAVLGSQMHHRLVQRRFATESA